MTVPDPAKHPKPSPPGLEWGARWQRFSASSMRAFHAYAGWLVSISWRRFFVLALLLIVVMAILHDKPPLTWTVTERVDHPGPRVVVVPQPPATPGTQGVPKGGPAARVAPPTAPAAPAAPQAPVVVDRPSGNSGNSSDSSKRGVEITVDGSGVHIRTKPAAPVPAAPAASAAPQAHTDLTGDDLVLKEDIREAVQEAKRDIEQAMQEARRDAEQAMRDAEQARKDAQEALDELTGQPQQSTRTTRVGIGDFLMQLTLLWVAASVVIKITYKGRMQAEVKAAQATETAEAESLKRQVVEARMAAMQAQVEPHFLFNTLASIDHLIETDPPRASQMQKNLIALLRASMPTMRETATAGTSGPRDLGREIAVIKPYLEILKVRMEERLVTDIAVPDGLLSAEFPAMMIQTLVENAIKHGLEPKAEGGKLRVAAEIVHGKLQVTVADTGLGFGRAPTGGTGVGLANIRERLQLLYGTRAALTVTENLPSGTVVTVTVPYKTVAGTAE